MVNDMLDAQHEPLIENEHVMEDIRRESGEKGGQVTGWVKSMRGKWGKSSPRVFDTILLFSYSSVLVPVTDPSIHRLHNIPWFYQ